MPKTPPDILDLPLEVRAEMALKEAVQEVIDEHIRDGRPLYIWRDGKVVALSPQELQASSSKPH